MHTFQPYPIEVLELNPFTKIGSDWAVLTAGNEEKVNAMTVSWGGLGVLWGKNVGFIFVRDSRYTKEFIDNGDTFSLTFFPKDFHKTPLKYLGGVSGRNEDKIKAAHLGIDYADGVPYIDEGDFVITFKKLSATKIMPEDFIDGTIQDTFYKDGDLHTMYVGEILSILAR
ncbi:MAG: flavin reductase family protein [Lachnospiraceae bacterium]|nr:flavin reductase family protein [Lachnospiraceae bacterium]